MEARSSSRTARSDGDDAGWLLAAISQGLSLGVCLWLYSQFQPWYVYPIMAYCILMILYLNSQDVRVVFLPRRSAARQEPGGAA